MSALTSTVAAISTPPGKGGIGIVRLSGPEALAVADRVFRPVRGGGFSSMKGYTARLGNAVDREGKVLDQCVGLCFRAPRSYTGEDVAELQCHGGEAATQAVLRAVLDAGASPAGRGEFTRRAFLNGRISLTEAEAVMEIINASTAQGERAAAGLMQKLGVPVNDLYTLASRFDESFYSDATHFSEKGCAALAEKVTEACLMLL